MPSLKHPALTACSRHRERNPEQWSGHRDKAILGVCMGTLPAIAAAAARSITELLQLAPIFLQLSFRLGLEVSCRSLLIEESQDSWSVAVSGISTETIRRELSQFNQSKVRQRTTSITAPIAAKRLVATAHTKDDIRVFSFIFVNDAKRATLSPQGISFFRTNVSGEAVAASNLRLFPCIPSSIARRRCNHRRVGLSRTPLRKLSIAHSSEFASRLRRSRAERVTRQGSERHFTSETGY